MAKSGAWRRGERVVLRYRRDGRIGLAVPALVVEDSPECVALSVSVGTPLKLPVDADGAPIPRSLPYDQRAVLPWRLGDGTWRETSVLWLSRPGAAHAVGVFWREPERAFVGWYVDLQDPLTRTSVGVDSRDHLLDVQVAPDRSWRWKDEDEFAAAQRLGDITPEGAAAIRAEGRAVVASIERWGWPFDAGWERWRPDASWAVPSLPEDWDVG